MPRRPNRPSLLSALTDRRRGVATEQVFRSGTGQGPQGDPGAPGSVWRSGTGAPAGGLGVVGDWYLNTANGDVYEKTGASTWTLRDNLTGPTGLTGAQGPQGDQGPAGADGTGAQAYACQGRLTLVSGDAVPGADQTAKSTLYFTPYNGSAIALYDGAAWVDFTLTERSIALSGLTSGKNYDVFIYDNAGTLTLELLAWTDDTTRATALTTQNGVLVKSGATTRRYLGTIRTTSTTTTEDSAAKRFVWNFHNRRRRALKRIDTTTTWTYQTNAWRQARADAANQVAVVIGVAEDAIELTLDTRGAPGTGSDVEFGIGQDSTTPHADCSVSIIPFAGSSQSVSAGLVVQPAIGYHYYPWLERTLTAANAATLSGERVSTTVWARSALRGTCFA